MGFDADLDSILGGARPAPSAVGVPGPGASRSPFDDELDSILSNDLGTAFRPRREIEPERGSFGRGWSTAIRQTVPLFQGAVGATAAAAEQALGAGGVATAVKDWGLRKYQEGMKQLEPLQRPTDDVTESWRRMTEEGDFGAMLEWTKYALGYGAAQIGETALVGVIGATLGTIAAPGPGTVAGAAGGAVARGTVKTAAQSIVDAAVRRELASIAKRQTAELVARGATAQVAAKQAAQFVASDLAQKTAVRSVAQKIGATAALGAYNVGQEVGSIFPEAVEQAEKAQREFTGNDLAKAWGTGIAAGAVESLTDLLGLGAVTGKIRIPGVGGRVARGATGAAIGGTVEAGTEATQTVLERFGASKSLTGEEAFREIVNSAAMGALPGSVVGGVSGAVHRPTVGPGGPAQPPRTAKDASTPQEAAELPIADVVKPEDILGARAEAVAQQEDADLDSAVSSIDFDAVLAAMHANASAQTDITARAGAKVALDEDQRVAAPVQPVETAEKPAEESAPAIPGPGADLSDAEVLAKMAAVPESKIAAERRRAMRKASAVVPTAVQPAGQESLVSVPFSGSASATETAGREALRDEISKIRSLVDEAAAQAATSPTNDLPEPTAEKPSVAPAETAVTEGQKPAKRSGRKAAGELRAAIREHYTPGNIVKGYGGTFDRVLAFNESQDGWQVRVENVVKQPDGTWKATERPRWHATAPYRGDAVVERAASFTATQPTATQPSTVDQPASSATHKDPGQPAEPVTAEVILEAVQKSAGRTPLNLAEAKKNLLAMVDKAIADAPNAESINLVREFKKGEAGQITKVGESEAPDAKSEGGKAYRAWLAENIGYVKLDVPGDGTFSVLNLKDNLQQFRKRVEGSAGFRAAPKAPPKPPKLEGTITSDPAGTMRDMLVDGEIANGLAMADALGAKLAYGAGLDGNVLVYTDAEDVKIGENTLLVGKATRKFGVAKRGETQGYDWHVIHPGTGLSAGVGKTAAIAIDKARDAIARLKQSGKTMAQYAAEASKNNKDAADQETLARRAREQALEAQERPNAKEVQRALASGTQGKGGEGVQTQSAEETAPRGAAAAVRQVPTPASDQGDDQPLAQEIPAGSATPIAEARKRLRKRAGQDGDARKALRAPLQAERQDQPAASTEPRKLSEITVTVPAADEKTGAPSETTETADVALARVDEQITKARMLLKCLQS